MVQGLDKARAGVVKMGAQWTSCWTSVCPPKIVRRLRRCGRFAKLMESEKVASTLMSAWPPAPARRCATPSTSASQSTPAEHNECGIGKVCLESPTGQKSCQPIFLSPTEQCGSNLDCQRIGGMESVCKEESGKRTCVRPGRCFAKCQPNELCDSRHR